MIRALRLVHGAVLFFVLLGWMSPFRPLLWAHVVTIPLLILQWRLNQGTCILTNIETRWGGEQKSRDQQQGQFIKSLLSKCFDPLPSDKSIKIGLYSILYLSLTISVLRLSLERGA